MGETKLMTDKVDDWSRPIEYVAASGTVYGAKVLGTDSHGRRAVIAYFDLAGSTIFVVDSTGVSQDRRDGYIRNEPEREKDDRDG